jgi:hypothetical protein
MPPESAPPMIKDEKKRLSGVVGATEYLFLENIALKLVLEHREVANWQKTASPPSTSSFQMETGNPMDISCAS